MSSMFDQGRYHPLQPRAYVLRYAGLSSPRHLGRRACDEHVEALAARAQKAILGQVPQRRLYLLRGNVLQPTNGSDGHGQKKEVRKGL